MNSEFCHPEHQKYSQREQMSLTVSGEKGISEIEMNRKL